MLYLIIYVDHFPMALKFLKSTVFIVAKYPIIYI